MVRMTVLFHTIFCLLLSLPWPYSCNVKHIHFAKLYCSKITPFPNANQFIKVCDIRQFDKPSSVAVQNHSPFPGNALPFFPAALSSLMLFHLPPMPFILIFEDPAELEWATKESRASLGSKGSFSASGSRGPIRIFIPAVVTPHGSSLPHLSLRLECELLEGRKCSFSFSLFLNPQHLDRWRIHSHPNKCILIAWIMSDDVSHFPLTQSFDWKVHIHPPC